MADLIAPDMIAAAARALEGVVVRTPLLPAPWLGEAAGAGAGKRGPEARRDAPRLKCENLQHAGAFKARGATTMISRLPERERERGVITYSSGNHGQAVAFAARRFEVPAVVVMPTTAPRIKIDGVRRLGGEVVFEGTTSLERQARAERIAAERGLAVVPPFDHPDIIAGQGTVGREILEDWPEVEAILVPIGGGGLVSGIAAWVKYARPECRVVGVEPEGADAMRRSLAEGRPVTLDSVDTLADGLAPVRPGDLTFAHASEFVDEVVTVADDALRDAVRRLFTRSKLVVEFSGAAAVAALLSGRWRPDDRRTAAVLSGGHLDPALAAELLNPDHR